jgi:hypothetical protein
MNNLPSPEEILNNPCFVVCLKRNAVRFYYTKKLLNKAGFTNVYPFEAVDGVRARDALTDWDKRIRPFGKMLGTPFAKNEDGEWYHGAGGQFGITLSLLTLWGLLSVSSKSGLMIFEDDALPRPDFPEVFARYWLAIEEPDVDMVYVGSQIHPNDLKNDIHSSGYYVNSSAQCMHAHYITKQGADKILNLMPHISEMRLRSTNATGQVDTDFSPIDTLLTQIARKDGLQREFKKYGIKNIEIPPFKCVSLVGAKVPVKGKYEGVPWEGRDSGLIHQNGDLASTLHGLNAARMRKEEATAQLGKDVFHDGIFEMDPETGEGKINDPS